MGVPGGPCESSGNLSARISEKPDGDFLPPKELPTNNPHLNQTTLATNIGEIALILGDHYRDARGLEVIAKWSQQIL